MDGVTVQERLAGHPGVAEIVLDRTEALNAIDTAMAYRLAQACAELAADRREGIAAFNEKRAPKWPGE